MFIVNHRKFFYALSAILVAGSLVALAVWGLKPGIDFKGGSIVEVDYATSTRPATTAIQPGLNALNLGEYSLLPAGATGFILRTPELMPDAHTAVLSVLDEGGKVSMTEKEFDSVGPTLGRETLQKSWISVVMVLAAIVLFITFAFRKVSKPVSSWKYGIIAVICLLHNIIIPIGVFALLGHGSGIEVDALFITALLVIIGFSVHDNIVVFDRVRENLHRNAEGRQKKDFTAIVGESINQTFVRSVNTSLTTLIAIFVLYLVGAQATQYFALALLVGITSGTYSSIFLGSPLLVTVYKWQEGKKA